MSRVDELLSLHLPPARRGLPVQPVKWLIIGTAILVLLGIVAWPLAWLFKFSLTSEDGHFTLETFRTVVTEPGMLDAAWNSLRLVVSVVICTTFIGTLLAWIVARTDTPGKNLIVGAVGITFVIPTFITVIAWIFLAAPNSGYLNTLLKSLLHLEAQPFNIISFSGLVFIETLHLYPLVFFSVLSALNNVDASYEQAARILGAGRLRSSLTITLPLVLPAILASTILVMLDTLSSFGAPAVIGTMANFSVLTTKLYDLMSFPPHLNMAAAIAVPIVLYTLLCLAVQRLFIGHDDFRTLSGKVTKGQVLSLGRWRWLMMAVVVAVVFISVVLPMTSLLLLSLIKVLGVDISLDNLALENYRHLFNQSEAAFGAMKNSLTLAFATATLCASLAVICAWVVERTQLAGRGTITVLIMIAYGFPSIAFGVGIMLGYVSALYGTLTLLLIAYTAKQLPVAFVLVRTALRQISVDLEEAARIAGAGWLRIMLDITLPLLKVSVGIGWVLVFSLSIRELSMSVMLAQTDSQVMSTVIMQYIADGSIEQAATLSVIIVAISVLVLGIVWKVSGRTVSSSE
ncbi:ABC transporter permease [Trabulsiella odontotermitis]|uniref:ABC transporter permease n=1 Tax=Trabulsiella odontotermitis TaxID=379893 RepID=UPI0006BA2799|nr:iron ABC transporter permease [Trabulsiella odontotermitis]